tara:strand:+ start:434 stop:1360 length:927 start_codon:yes stop_codon:yes gene_type:complete
VKKKNILITGGTGFIGSNLAKSLLKNYNVKIYDNFSRRSLKNIKKIPKQIKIIKGDIRDKDKFFKALKKTDIVIHLAYINGTRFFYSKPVDILDIAIKGIVNVFDGCIKYNIKELYLASSSEVYQTPKKIPTNELESLKIPNVHNPRYSYGGGKILTELMGIHYGKKYFKKLIIFRPHNVYGKNMGQEHVIPEFINRFKKIKGKNFKIQGSGNEIRSFIFIEDFVKAFELIMKKGKHLNIYNIGTSQKIKIRELAIKMSKIFKKKIIIKKGKLSKGGTKIRTPDITKIKRLGFKPRYNLDSGMKKILK